MLIEAPGIYKNVSNEDYHASKGISNSGLRLLLPPNCPRIYWYQKLSGLYQRKESDDYKIGSAVHTLTLEPETFESRFMVVQSIPGRGSKLGKDAHAAMLVKAGTREILDAVEYDKSKAMAESITNHKIWKNLKGNRKGNIEDSIMWKDADSGALLRTRPDYYDDLHIVDVKTTKDVTPRSFANSVLDYGYHSQGAMACDGLTEMTGREYDMVVLFVVSKQPPYLCRCYVLTNEAIEKGRQEYKQGAAIFQQCLDSGIWNSYPEVIEDINLPNWVYRTENET